MTKVLNEFAQNNLRILNQEKVEILRSGDYRQTPAPIMKCVKCGGWGITTPVMKYFDWDGASFKCYKCQKQSKTLN